MDILKEVGIKSGYTVLDYGCGPGSYIEPTAELVGELGKVYALDIHPIAVKKVQDIAVTKKLANIETILSDCKTGLSDSSIDIVFLYDIFHQLSNQSGVLLELNRVLKNEGILSFSDHHMKEDEISNQITISKLFKLFEKGKSTYSFIKEN